MALLWTVPVGVLIGTNRRVANILQPVVQVIAAIPATALFPIVLLALLNQLDLRYDATIRTAPPAVISSISLRESLAIGED